MKDFEKKIVDNDEVLNIVIEIKILIKEDMYKNDSIKDLKEDYPNRIEKFQVASLYYIGGSDFKILKTEFSDNMWKYLAKKISISIRIFQQV